MQFGRCVKCGALTARDSEYCFQCDIRRSRVGTGGSPCVLRPVWDGASHIGSPKAFIVEGGRFDGMVLKEASE